MVFLGSLVIGILLFDYLVIQCEYIFPFAEVLSNDTPLISSEFLILTFSSTRLHHKCPSSTLSTSDSDIRIHSLLNMPTSNFNLSLFNLRFLSLHCGSLGDTSTDLDSGPTDRSELANRKTNDDFGSFKSR